MALLFLIALLSSPRALAYLRFFVLPSLRVFPELASREVFPTALLALKFQRVFLRALLTAAPKQFLSAFPWVSRLAFAIVLLSVRLAQEHPASRPAFPKLLPSDLLFQLASRSNPYFQYNKAGS